MHYHICIVYCVDFDLVNMNIREFSVQSLLLQLL